MSAVALRSSKWHITSFLLPNLIGLLLFTLGPVLFSLAVAATNWDLQRSVPFAITGFENLRALAHDSAFARYFVNTVYMMIGMPISIGLSLAFALLLNQKLKGMVVYRTLFYLPSFTSGVAVMILWKALYNPDFGPINAAIGFALDHGLNGFLSWFGAGPLHAPAWLQSTNNLAGLEVERAALSSNQFGLGARDALIIMGIWITAGGNNMLLYLAALSNVPEELVEAAKIDGANRWEVFKNITWPALAPTTFFITVISFIYAFQGGFEQARVMTAGGPAGTTTTLSYYVYQIGFEEFRVGYASAVSWVLFAIIFGLTLVYWKFGNQEGVS